MDSAERTLPCWPITCSCWVQLDRVALTHMSQLLCGALAYAQHCQQGDDGSALETQNRKAPELEVLPCVRNACISIELENHSI